MGEVVHVNFRAKPRLIHPTCTHIADLAYAMGKAQRRSEFLDLCGVDPDKRTPDWFEKQFCEEVARANEQDTQASVKRVFTKRGCADPCEGTSKPGDQE